MVYNKLLFTYLEFLALLVASEAFLRNTTIFDFRRSDTAGTSHGTKNLCVDDPEKKYVAPAKDCFDFFTLAIVWSPGYAYKQKLNDLTLRKRIRPSWNIHGLWPSWYSGQENPLCNRIEQFFVEHRLKDAQVLRPFQSTDKNLHSIISKYWFTVLKKPINYLWEHEFKKHGNCATRSSKIKDGVGYFQRTYDLYGILNLYVTLYNAGLRPGGSKKLSDIIDILKKRVLAKVKVDYTKEFVKEENSTKAYLTEVFVCYDTEFTRTIDCPNLSRQERDGALIIMYPENIP